MWVAKSWKSDWNQTSWFIDIIWEPSYVHGVKGQIPRSKVIWGQVVRQTENVKVVSFEKLKFDLNQTWLIDIIWEYSYVHAVKGRIPRSNVICGQLVNLHHPQTATAGNTSGPGTTKYFCFSGSKSNLASHSWTSCAWSTFSLLLSQACSLSMQSVKRFTFLALIKV